MCAHTHSTSIQRPHVKDIHALHLAEDLQALETGALLEVGRDGAGLAARGQEVGLGGDFYTVHSSALPNTILS